MKKKQPLYRTIYEEILQNIETGKYKPGDKIPTEAEWAEQYKVSRITSKKALDMAAENRIIVRRPGKGSFIAEDSKKRVHSTQCGTKCAFGIIQHDLSDSFGLGIFRTLEHLSQKSNILTVTGHSNNDLETEKKLISAFYDYGVDGFIISPVHNETFNNEILKLIIDGFPVVLIDRYLREVSCPNVISKNFEAAYEGMKYLYCLGHQNIGILSRPIGSATTLMEREKGIMHAIVESGRPFRQEWWATNLEDLDRKSEDSFQTIKKQVKSFLSEHPELTAIFGLKYPVIPIVEVAAHELGLRIPDDLSLICFDSPGLHVNHIKPVTHLKQNKVGIAEQAFSMILQLLQGKAITEYRHEIDVDLVVGETTAPPRE